MEQQTRSDPLADVRPPGDAWVRVRREMSDVAGQTSGQIQRRWLSRASALLRHHVHQSLNFAYRELIEDSGADPVSAIQTSAGWARIPVIDKQWLARAGYHRRPACPGPVLVVALGGRGDQGIIPAVAGQPGHRDRGAGLALAPAIR
jgi:hypothetical protein